MKLSKKNRRTLTHIINTCLKHGVRFETFPTTKSFYIWFNDISGKYSSLNASLDDSITYKDNTLIEIQDKLQDIIKYNRQ